MNSTFNSFLQSAIFPLVCWDMLEVAGNYHWNWKPSIPTLVFCAR